MPEKSLRALRRQSASPAWRVTASTAPHGGQTRLILNALRDTGAATELTSTAYLVTDAGAALVLAERLALGLGRGPSDIVWCRPMRAPACRPAPSTVIAA